MPISREFDSDRVSTRETITMVLQVHAVIEALREQRESDTMGGLIEQATDSEPRYTFQGSHNRMSGCPGGYAGNSTLKKIHRAVRRKISCAVLLCKDSPQPAAAWPGKFRVPRFPGHCGTFWTF